MGIIQKVFSAFKGGEQDTLPVIVKSGSLGSSWFDVRDKLADFNNGAPGTLTPQLSITQAFKRYRSWVYSCVNLIQHKIVETDYYLYKEVGQPNDEEYDRILQHPLIRLLKKPNAFQSGREFKQATQIHLDLSGMAFWLILFNGFGVPGELHLLSPMWLVQIIRGQRNDNLIEGFSFAPPYQRQMARTYPYAQIVYFHYPNPEDPLQPMSPLQPISTITDLDLLLQAYERDFFGNNARPDFVFKTPPGQYITNDEADRFHEQWEARHRGSGKAHRPAILSGGFDVAQLGMSARDFEFQATNEYVKDQILASYGIPEAELGLFESFNKSSSITSETKFVKGCIEPRLRLWEDVINTQLLPFYHNSSDLEFRHESALPKDDEWRLTETQGNLSMGISTINEERKKRGLKSFASPLCNVPWSATGEPIRGCDQEADKLWDEKMQSMMGQPAGGMPGQDPMAAMMGGGPPPVPQAQGAMGNLGGRPEGQALSTILNSASRRTNTPLAMLLNAARGRRGGLSELLRNYPNEVGLSSILDRNRSDQALSRLLGGQKGYVAKGYEELTPADKRAIRSAIYEFLESDLEEEDKMIFRSYEGMIIQIDPLEETYERTTEGFYIQKGAELSQIVDKMIGDFVTKGIDDLLDYTAMAESYKRMIFPLVEKAVEIGHYGAFSLIERAGKNITVKAPEDFAKAAVEQHLDRFANFRVNSVKKPLAAIIEAGIEEGWNIDDVADAIKDKFKGMSGPRTQLIARTEMSAALNAGLDANYRQINSSGLVVKEAVVWASLTDRMCDECKEAHGKTAIDYVRDRVVRELPLHPNCECAYKPVLAKNTR